MRTSEVFILGTVAGAVVIWLWGREIQGSVRGKTRELRTKAADGIRAVETQTGKVLEQVSDALRAGEVAIRPASATREA
jgi:paraquat-inducible protein B